MLGGELLLHFLVCVEQVAAEEGRVGKVDVLFAILVRAVKCCGHVLRIAQLFVYVKGPAVGGPVEARLDNCLTSGVNHPGLHPRLFPIKLYYTTRAHFANSNKDMPTLSISSIPNFSSILSF